MYNRVAIDSERKIAGGKLREKAELLSLQLSLFPSWAPPCGVWDGHHSIVPSRRGVPYWVGVGHRQVVILQGVGMDLCLLLLCVYSIGGYVCRIRESR
ncbi:hypothetical protein BP00DRAFT_116582 [Aspergillus indologenus CBS 114.80]|uniref:Uncharacterized protein n=1 Tax=Aspergillus indologenus CBS 114.80 TaxID=1450541 RepID=A0A2V5HT46_9EURO|nr:hypothetical protein BP00DRAFT_116582 [Aspergillus indologenus CBS 114.80]